MDVTYLLGIDGGGTKTDFVITDTEFQVIKELRMTGCNPMDIGIDSSKELLKKGICEVCENIPFSKVVMFAGIAGGSSGNMKMELESFFETFGLKAFQNGSDTQNIVSAGIQDEDGVILILGTGHCAIAQHNGVQERVAGWGYLFDDGGSGYNIARDALAAGFRCMDGSGEYTLFADYALKQYGNPQALLGALYAGGKKLIASFCPMVFECAKEHDSVCMDIIKRNMEYAAGTIRTAAGKVGGGSVRVVAAGGLSRLPLAMKYLTEALSDDERYDLSILEELPVKGALIYAKKIADHLKEENE